MQQCFCIDRSDFFIELVNNINLLLKEKALGHQKVITVVFKLYKHPPRFFWYVSIPTKYVYRSYCDVEIDETIEEFEEAYELSDFIANSIINNKLFLNGKTVKLFVISAERKGCPVLNICWR